MWWAAGERPKAAEDVPEMTLTHALVLHGLALEATTAF